MVSKTLHISCALLVLAGTAFGQEQKKPEPDKASAYYHYALGHLYAEQAAINGNRGDYFNKAIENYKLAMKDDTTATFIGQELSDLYIQSGRLREAVVESE